MSMVSAPFRALFLLRNRMENIQVVPLGSTRADGSSVLGGTLEGRPELLAFVTEIGFDSIVESFQVSDLPRPSFLRTYHLAPNPGAIVRLLEERLVAEPRFAHRVLDMTMDKSPEQLTLAPQEAFQLGATMLDAAQGILRTTRWFGRARESAA
jgi:hypothetical protein